MSDVRVGQGFDAHRLAPGRPLMLGGVEVPHDRGLEGHSDGDCLLHAVCDAILGAMGAGDMGRHFPNADPQWKDAPSARFVERVAALARESGWTIGNLDATIVAQSPMLSPHLRTITERVATLLGVPPAAVNVKAKSTDGLGALGRAEGIAALAVVLLHR